MTTAIYERVSTRGQDLASQHAELEAWSKGAVARGETVQWFSDKFTGKTLERPGMNRLLSEVRAGKVHKIVCYRLDRLGRTAKGLTALFEELTSLQVGFVSLREGIDLTTPAGRLIANVLASVASYETEIRGERIAAGFAAKRTRGEKINSGRPKGSAHKATPEARQMIRQLRDRGYAIAAIARQLKLSRNTVYACLL
jgi:DNA invertase Pin-like site-specific DNA recombinase